MKKAFANFSQVPFLLFQKLDFQELDFQELTGITFKNYHDALRVNYAFPEINRNYLLSYHDALRVESDWLLAKKLTTKR